MAIYPHIFFEYLLHAGHSTKCWGVNEQQDSQDPSRCVFIPVGEIDINKRKNRLKDSKWLFMLWKK